MILEQLDTLLVSIDKSTSDTKDLIKIIQDAITRMENRL